ncbi:MAG: YdcF family protein [Lachnospiraceae bacterium]|nr:YdcF family protein [Lachnospiraceae bacterium]
MDIITAVMMILTGLCLVHYIVIISYTGLRGAFAGFWLFSTVIFAVFTTVSSLFTKYGVWGKVPLPVYAVVISGAAVAIICFMILIGMIISGMNARPDKVVDYLIVLGAKVDKKRITKSLRKRLEKATEYLKENPDTIVIVSGGKGKGEDITEAEAMAGYLSLAGIEEYRIIKEDKSTSTKENLQMSYNIIREQNKDASYIAVTTNNFHIFRAVAIAKKLGIKNVYGLAAKADPILIINYIFRECAAVIKEIMLDNI